MLPASNRGAGMNIGFPDVCLTPAPPAPPIPVPYPNIALNAQALGFSPVVKVSGVNALNMGSKISMTTGDEAGAAHPTIKGMGQYTMGNPIVSIDKLPAINLACPTTGNMMNNPIGLVAVPSAVNVMFCYASEGPTSSVDEDELDHLAEAMSDARVGVELLPGDVALVRFGCFAPGLATEVFRALRSLGEAFTALVFDLRGNPGGDLHSAIALAAELAREGDVVVRLREPDGEVRELATPAGARYAEPVVLLVDRATASAAEVFVALLKTSGRATVVGGRTYGKTRAQKLEPLRGDSRRCELGEWSVGDVVHADGVSPDVELVAALPGEPDAWLKTAWAIALGRRA